MYRLHYFTDETEIASVYYTDSDTRRRISIVETDSRLYPRCAENGSLKQYDIDNINEILFLGPLVENFITVPHDNYDTFSNFSVNSYMPDTDDTEFYDLLQKAVERIKTNFPYANCDFLKVRLPRVKKDKTFNDNENLYSGYYDCVSNVLGITSNLDLDAEDDTYLHEIIHLAAARAYESLSYVYEEKGYDYSTGFNDSNNNGVGTNEGMTEYLTELITGKDHAYYLNRRLIKFMMSLAPDKEDVIKKYFECDTRGLSFIGNAQDVHVFVKNFDLLHNLDDDISSRYDICVSDEIDVMLSELEGDYSDVEDLPSDELASEIEQKAYQITEDTFMYEFEEADFLPNCQRILLKTFKRRLEEVSEDEREDLIRDVIDYMIFTEEIEDITSIDGYSALNPKFIAMDKMRENDEEFFNICVECGYDIETIKSIYEDEVQDKITVIDHFECDGYIDDEEDYYDDDEYEFDDDDYIE